MRVLIIKLTSMGDLMHVLPALTDAAAFHPDIRFDWVVDRAFADVPKWHPRVERVITSSHRSWRKNWLSSWRHGELQRFYRELNAHDYDVIVDMQGNLKSALVSLLRRGRVHGPDTYSCREKPAHWAYAHHYNVNPRQHAVARMRQTMALALGYALPAGPPVYGSDLRHCRLPQLDFELSPRYLMLVHNASWQTKLWPLEAWQALVLKAAAAGFQLLLPSGNEEEYRRALDIASVSPQAHALPRLPLDNVAALMRGAAGAVCSDTGLAHLAALLGSPAITLYGPTDPDLIGTEGENQQHVVSTLHCVPCYKRRCALPESRDGEPVCMAGLSPDMVWHRLHSILQAQ